MSDLQVIEMVEVSPIQPAEFNIDDIWKELRNSLRAQGRDIREVVFDLWSGRTTADIIMKVTGLTENELDAIIPRSRWLESKWVKCTRCRGRGGAHITVPWSQK